jgi:hypothetical protein
VRVRHVASGKYLAVETSEPIKHLQTMNEDWFSAFLVDDAAGEEDPTPGMVVAAPEQMTFYLSSADVTQDPLVPDSVSDRCSPTTGLPQATGARRTWRFASSIATRTRSVSLTWCTCTTQRRRSLDRRASTTRA